MRRAIGLAILAMADGGAAWAASAVDIMAPHQQRMPHTHTAAMPTPLQEAGNDAFAAIQEAIAVLAADPKTDWSRVDLEALRQHLIDMNNMTLAVEVISKDPIDRGVSVVVRPMNTAAAQSLARVLAAHPPQLKQETGWTMAVTKGKDSYRIEILTTDEADVDKIRALGYIGVMALGAHHPLHHWAIVQGDDPHTSHSMK